MDYVIGKIHARVKHALNLQSIEQDRRAPRPTPWRNATYGAQETVFSYESPTLKLCLLTGKEGSTRPGSQFSRSVWCSAVRLHLHRLRAPRRPRAASRSQISTRTEAASSVRLYGALLHVRGYSWALRENGCSTGMHIQFEYGIFNLRPLAFVSRKVLRRPQR